MALPYATENQLKQVTKSEVTKAINPILATGSIRKKPYVEKVVESLSSESLELLRETLNTNKDNVNVSLVGGSNLLKKFEKNDTNTQLTGRIPQVGDVVEKVYFNPNAYSTDEEWKLWFESMKDESVADEDEKRLGTVKYNVTNSYLAIMTSKWQLQSVTLTDIIVLNVCNARYCVYVTNKALTGTYAQVYQQLGITETGWYEAFGTTSDIQSLKKIESLRELDISTISDTISVTAVNDDNAPLFAKVLSYNETFTETPIQNLLKPNPIQVGQEVSKIYINLGYFDNDLNKMVAFGDKTLFKWQNGEDTYELKTAFHYEESDQVCTTQFELYKNGEDSQPCVYLNQGLATMIGGLAGKDFQEYVNKWVKVKNNTTEVEELENQKVFELEIQGTITELGDTSLISFNKPFEVEGGWIYEDVTPVTLELEKDSNQDGILIWDDIQCVLLAYYPYKNLIDIFVIDPEDYTYEKLSESATIEELRRVVFTPTQEDTALNINNLSLEEDEVIFDKVFKSSDLENSGKTLLVEDNVKLFDINAVYKAQSELTGTEFQLYAKPINELEIEFNAVITQANGDIEEIKLWVELSNDLSHYVLSSLAILNILSTSNATVQTQVFNFFKFAMDNEEATLPIKLTKMKYVSK